MTQAKRSTTLLLAMALSAGAVSASSWLIGELPEAESEAASPSLLGLFPAESALRPYQHPFGAQAATDTWRARTGMLQPGKFYLVRTAEGPADRREQPAFMAEHLKTAVDAQLAFVGATIHRGGPHTPLMGIARFDGTEPVAPPVGLVAAEVESAEVHLCLLGLGEAKDGSDSREAPLQISAPLNPELALRRAVAVARHAAPSWGTPGQIPMSLAQLKELWPDAVQNLLDAGIAEKRIILAQRVLWKAGTRQIPGPGGTLLKAVNYPEASQRLQALYSPVGLPRE